MSNLVGNDESPDVILSYEKQIGEDEWEAFTGDPIDAGTYRVTASTVAGGNYARAESQPVVFTIMDSSQLAVFLVGNLDKTYDGKSVDTPTLTVRGVRDADPASPTVVWKWEKLIDGSAPTVDASWSDVAANPKDAGSYRVSVTVTATNYAPKTSKYLEFTIDQADPKVTITKDPSKHYDGKPAAQPEFTTEGSVKDASLEWFAADPDHAGQWVKLESAPTKVGSYKVVVTVAAGGNYAGGSASREFTIDANTEMTVALSGTWVRPMTEARL